MQELPVGLYDRLVTEALAAVLPPDAEVVPLGEARAAEVLAAHVADRVRAALRDVDDPLGLVRRVLGAIAEPREEEPAPPARLLQAVHPPASGVATPERFAPPLLPLRESALLVNGPREINVLAAVECELASADAVDLLCAFLKFSGLRLLRQPIAAFVRRGGRLRVLTTVYTGATEARAVDELVRLGAEVRVSYETASTRLHAKAWLFERGTGYSTALVGSSNLSKDALVDGLEWNVRLSAVENPALLEKVRATFAQYWEEPAFEPYDPERDGARLRAALTPGARGGSAWTLRIHVEPKPHQRILLEALSAERDGGRHRNLVVAATGTGKTWVAAFDYARLCAAAGRRLRLLFVAHRKEILAQSQEVFRLVLQDRQFGQRRVDGEVPTDPAWVFASVQSLRDDVLARIDADFYEVVVVDEFHHAEGARYQALLTYLRPAELLGLTATPERSDGRDVRRWFDDRVAGELRLWHALDQGLLAPFHYFGVADPEDLRAIPWVRGRYDLAALASVYNGNTMRAERVLEAVRDYVADPRRMRALGFCVSVVHARFMARVFSERGLPAVAVHGETPGPERDGAVDRLERGEIVAIFTVDVFNEGVDIPAVDTVLFLRPTESATLFQQQLGRGLRLAPGKGVLTVLDLVGPARREFRFDLRYRALLGQASARQVKEAVEAGFPTLPAGCRVHLEEEPRKAVLDNLRFQLQNRQRARLVDQLRQLGPEMTLSGWLDACGYTLPDLYTGDLSWTALRRDAGFERRPAHPDERAWAGAFSRMLHVDDPARLGRYAAWCEGEALPLEETRMLGALLGGPRETIHEHAATLTTLLSHGPAREELAQLLDELARTSRAWTLPMDGVPLRVHATYTRAEILAALGELRDDRVLVPQTGVFFHQPRRVDLLFVTLDKSANSFTETTRYEDYPLAPDLFHWQSQGRTRPDDATGTRYRTHAGSGSRVWLFVRPRPKDERGVAVPFCFLGDCAYVEHRGSAPMSIVWRLRTPMPAALYQEAKVAAG